MESYEVAVWAGYALIAVVFSLFIYKTIKSMNTPAVKGTPTAGPAKVLRSESKCLGLQTDILKEGSGPKAKKGDILTVHYKAFHPLGHVVDSSYERGASVTFKLGGGRMIDGWEVALVGAQAGETRKVTVPANLAYGKKGSPNGKIPPGSNVIFDIEVLKIE
jgi:FKBP-type peptidyl-prolyl cis-trans isomerase